MIIIEFEKILEVEGDLAAQKLIDGGWKLLETAGGKNDDGYAYILYSLGKPKAST